MENPKLTTVQEVVTAGKGLPERYLYSSTGDGEEQPLNISVPEIEIPVIDFSLLLSSSDEGRGELSKLHSAFSTYGVIQVMNHGITEALLDKFYELTEQFFALPTEEKNKYAREFGSVQGYGNDMILSDDQVLDWTDRLFLTTYPEDQRQLQFWPEIPIAFRETLHEYTMKQHIIFEKLFKAMARSLDLEDDCFLDMCGGNVMMDTRFNMYPPCPIPEKVLGLKPHGDGSVFTLLLPNKNIEGLQFLKDGKWYKPSIIPYTILINVGDLTEIMSNGIYKSAVHRVVTNRDKARISVPTFCITDSDKEIQPLDELVSEEKPRMYKAIKNYEKIYFEYYQQNRSPIEAALI